MRVLSNVQETQALVEDHIIETQLMRRSPFVKPFIKDARYEFWCARTHFYCGLMWNVLCTASGSSS